MPGNQNPAATDNNKTAASVGKVRVFSSNTLTSGKDLTPKKRKRYQPLAIDDVRQSPSCLSIFLTSDAMNRSGSALQAFVRLSFSLSLSFAALAVSAQSGRDEGQRLLDERREQQRQSEIQRPTPAVSARPDSSAPGVDNAVMPADLVESAPSFRIDTIVLLGGRLLSDAEQVELTAPFIGLALGPRRIDLLLRRITGAYLERGYVTTRAYLGEQQLSSGRLVLNIVTGHIEDIVIDGEKTPVGTAPAWPLVRGAPLRLADIEQSVDQINRLRSRRAEATIQPGQSSGGSVLSMDTHPEKPWRVALAGDNHGLAATGVERQRLSLEVDHLLGLWDSWSVTRVESANARSELFSVSVPFGYGTASYTYAHSKSRLELYEGMVSATENASHTYGWNQVLARSQSSRQALDLTLVLRDTRRQLGEFDLMPQQQSAVRLAGSHLWRGARGSFSADLGYSRGVRRFGGDGDIANLPASSPHNEFEKWDGNLLFAWNVLPVLAWRLQVNGQFSRTGLPGSEQIYLGGVGSIRGFREGGVAGDRGAFARNELQWLGALPPALPAMAWRLTPYVFLDAGIARQIASREDQRLVSLGFGIRAGWKDVSADFNWGRPQAAPEGLSRQDTLNVSLTLQY